MKQISNRQTNGVIFPSFRKILFPLVLIFSTLFSSAQTDPSKNYQHWADVSGAWVNGILGTNNSAYFEAEIVPHVYISPTGLITGNSYSFDIVYNNYENSSTAGGFTTLAPYNASRIPGIDILGGNDFGTTNFTNFNVVNAKITAVSAPVASGSGNIDQVVTVTFTYTGDGNNTALFYYGLKLAKPGEVPPPTTLGSSAWSGGSLQTTVDNLFDIAAQSAIGQGALSLQIQPNAILEGKISGLKYNDLNKNGTQDAGEPALADWTIYLDMDNSGTLTDGDISTTTDGNGNYSFAGLIPGTYVVREVTQGWTQTQPAAPDFYTFTIKAETPSFTGVFGNFNCTTLTIGVNTPDPICAGQSTTLTATGGLTYTWTPAEGLSATTGASVTATPAATTTYTVEGTNANGCKGTNTVTVTVKASSAAPTTTPVSYCLGATAVPLTATGVGLTWYDANGVLLSAAPTPGTTIVGTTTYYVTSTEAGKCESDKTSLVVTIKDNSSAPTTTPVSYCQGATAVPLTATGAGLTWYDANGNKLTAAPTPVTTIVGTTTYYVTSTETDKCESAKTPLVVTVQANTAPPTVTSVSFCLGAKASPLSATAVSGAVLTWYNANGDLLAGAPTPGTAALGTTTYFVTAKEANKCVSTKSTIIVTINDCGYSYTQGFYGNSTTNNKTCNGTTLNIFLQGLLSSSLQVGGSVKGVLVPAYSSIGTTFNVGGKPVTKNSVDWLITIMPGGSTAAALLPGNLSILSTAFNNYTTATPAGYLTKTTKINNVLLAQTIALSLNARSSNAGQSFGNISLDPGALISGTGVVYIKTTQFKQLTGSCTNALGTCTNTYPLSKNVLKALDIKTVQGLLNLANDALNLGGTTGYTKNGSTFTWADLNNTIDAVNRAFDRGAMSVGFTGTPLVACTNTQRSANTESLVEERMVNNITVSAYPNPFTDRVKFSIVSPVSGKATLDVYNMMGQKVKTVFAGYLFANRTQVVDYNIPSSNKGALIYTLRVGDKQVNGKIVQIK